MTRPPARNARATAHASHQTRPYHHEETDMNKTNEAGQLGPEWVNARVSRGTMRDVDLIPRIEAVLDEAGAPYERPPAVEKLMADEDAGLTEDEREDVSLYVAETLWDAMSEVAPEGCYFGASEGDGSDFGFWENEPDTAGDEGPPEPEEGDLTTKDHRVFWSHGKVAFVVPDDDEWQPHARAWMDREQFWPNVWFVSDHGNAHLLGTSEEPSK